MYRTVMVPLDLSADADRALPVGAALAARIGVELDIVCVTSPNAPPGQDETEIRAHARSAGLEIDGIRLRFDEDVASGVLAEVAASDGLLCCATHARGQVADMFFHSLSGQLLRGSRTPLVLVGPHVPATPPRIAELLVCVDGQVSDHVMAAATTWGRLLRAKVHVLQVADPGLPQPYPSAERVADHLEERDLDATWELRRGAHPADEILDSADRMDGPLLIVGANDQHPDEPAYFGPVSLAVVHRSPHPVLVVPSDHVAG